MDDSSRNSNLQKDVVPRQNNNSNRPTKPLIPNHEIIHDHHRSLTYQVLNPPSQLHEAAEINLQCHMQHITNPKLPANLEIEQAQNDISDTDTGSDSSDPADQVAGEIQVLNQKHAREKDLTQQASPKFSTPLRNWKRSFGEQAEHAKSSMQSSVTPSQMGFSFNKGDDLDILGQRSSMCRTKGTPEAGTLRSTSEQYSQTETSKMQQRRTPAIPRLKQESLVSSVHSESEEDRALHRFDSTSSILTAFRAGGRQSSDDSRRNSSSSEAITAAIRAGNWPLYLSPMPTFSICCCV